MKLTDKIHLLRIDFEIAISPDKKLPRFVNVLIIFGDKITLIDTGVKESERFISEYIRQNGRDISEIDSVILSHSHPDHIGSASIIKELTGCRIMAHQAEKEWIESLDLQNSQRPVPGFFNLVDRPVKLDAFLADKDELKLADGLTLNIIHSPGHSKGSLNILFVEDKILFTADSIPLKNDIPNYDNYPDLLKSLLAIRTNRDYTTLLTSWTPPFTDPSEINRILDEGEDYLNRIDKAVRECFTNEKTDSDDCCKRTIEKLGLPLFLATPLVNKAFRSHMF
jgi:hydroxyacylglutathione hydrolase